MFVDKRKKLTEANKVTIRQMIEDGYADTTIAETFSVSKTTIYFIRNPDKYRKALDDNMRNAVKVNKSDRAKYMQEYRKRKKQD